MNKTVFKKFEKALVDNNKALAHELISAHLKTWDDFLDFYEGVIPSILNSIDCAEDDDACIWLEHQISGIVRSIVEASYQPLLKVAKTLSETKHVLIACVEEEPHELGALIGAHLFELYGFKTTFIGANTPSATIKSALKTLSVDYLVLSATNIYHISTLNKLLDSIKIEFPSVKVFGSGRGVCQHYHALHLDDVLNGSKDIERVMKKEGLTCSHSV